MAWHAQGAVVLNAKEMIEWLEADGGVVPEVSRAGWTC